MTSVFRFMFFRFLPPSHHLTTQIFQERFKAFQNPFPGGFVLLSALEFCYAASLVASLSRHRSREKSFSLCVFSFSFPVAISACSMAVEKRENQETGSRAHRRKFQEYQPRLRVEFHDHDEHRRKKE